jgi:hypothetical protein
MTATKTRRLQLENLEARELKAGNVQVYFANSDLYIVGDNAANAVSVRQSSPGVYKISGNTWAGDYTRINGYANGTCTASGINHDVRVIMQGGNDQLDFGVGDQRVINVPNMLAIDMGTGNDNVAIRDVKTGSMLSVNTGTGVDSTYAVGADVGTHFSIGDGGPVNYGDSDRATVLWSKVRAQLGFWSNQGNDSFDVESTTADSLFATLGAGDDTFQMNNSSVRSFNLQGGTGYDTFFAPGSPFVGSGFESIRR